LSEECISETIRECGYFTVCKGGMRRRLTRETLIGFRYLKPGQITTSVDLENDIVRYLYVDEAERGFFIEADITAGDRPECSSEFKKRLIPAIQEVLGGDPRLQMVLMIIETKMFPTA
jgi:hypothetical protein